MSDASDAQGSSQVLAANQLYWDTERSVSSIADELDLSRGALYGLIRPLETGLSCPECGGDLQYPNRTARDRGLVTCAGCGYQDAEAVAREAWVERRDEEGTYLDRGAPPDSSLRRQTWGAGLLVAAAVLAVSATLLAALRKRRT